MKKALRVAVSQLNTITGALNENVKNLEQGIALGHEIGADALIFPELCLKGCRKTEPFSERRAGLSMKSSSSRKGSSP